MARVRYRGWTDRKDRRQEHRIVTAGGCRLTRAIHTPNGNRLVFRGRAGKKSQPRTVEDREVIDFFEEHEDFEVQRS